MPIANCAEGWKGMPFKIIESQLCTARENHTDTCQGESGSPLQYMLNNTYYLAGVMSFETFCGISLPGINTRVSSFIDWIEDIVWPQ